MYKNLNHNPELLTKYDEVIQYQLNKGMIEMATKDKEERGGNIATRIMLSSNQTTTLSKYVYDASA